MRAFVHGRAAEDGIPDSELTDLQVAISEACTNVVRHAGVDEMKLRWRVEGDRVEVEVEDDGVFVERPPDSTRPGGFGISLMRSLMDEVVLLRGDRGHPGTRVLLVKRLSERAAPSIRPRRGGPRTRRLHSGRPVREARSRRVPIPNLVGFAVAAGAVAVLAVLGTLAVVHSSHPRTSLAAGHAPATRAGTASQPAVVHSSRPHHHAGTNHTSGPGANGTHAGPSSQTAPSPGSANPSLPEIPCPGSALLGVYAPVRFDVLDTCRWIEGRVTSIHLQLDGNHRIAVRTSGGETRVVEIILGQRLPLPRAGEHLAAFGTLVRAHAAGWTGLEPAWAIDYVDRGFTRRALPPAKPLATGGNTVCVPSTSVCASVPVPTPSVSVPVSVPSIP